MDELWHINDLWDVDDVEEVDEVAEIRLPRRVIRDRLNPLTTFSNEEFLKRYRLSKQCTQDLLDRIRPNLPRMINRRGNPIPPDLQLYTCLRYLASGSFQISMADCSDLSQPSVSRCVKAICHAIASLADEWIKFPSPEEETNVSAQFAAIGGMPGVLGCVDGTHVPIVSPGGNIAELYRCRKGYYSLNLMGICDPSLKFINIVTSSPGSVHDSRVFENSQVCNILEQGRYRGYLLGDSGYPCRTYLLSPLLAANTDSERSYNAAHIKTRNLVERSFGVIKRRFAVLSIPVRTALPTTKKLIMACAVLHNMAIHYAVPLPEEEEAPRRQVEQPQLVVAPEMNPQNARLGFTLRRHIIETCF